MDRDESTINTERCVKPDKGLQSSLKTPWDSQLPRMGVGTWGMYQESHIQELGLVEFQDLLVVTHHRRDRNEFDPGKTVPVWTVGTFTTR